jgi:hypothetical protein
MVDKPLVRLKVVRFNVILERFFYIISTHSKKGYFALHLINFEEKWSIRIQF